MAIIAKVGGEGFTLCPAGTHPAVCVDVVDLGMVDTEFNGEKKKTHKIRIVWQIDEANPENSGRPFTAAKRYTLSLHEKATLRKDLESWRGRSFTSSELEGFDLENLLEVGAFINVLYESKNGKTYDNVTSIMRLPRQIEAPKMRDYVRVCNRKRESEATPPVDPETFAPSDDDVPF